MKNLKIERANGYPRTILCGADEVGRGCIAGPVVAACVVLPEDLKLAENPWLLEVTDSKALLPHVREILVPKIKAWAADSAIGVAGVGEIDELNIFHASYLAMKRAIDLLRVKPGHVLVDGNFKIPSVDYPQTPVVQTAAAPCTTPRRSGLLSWRIPAAPGSSAPRPLTSLPPKKDLVDAQGLHGGCAEGVECGQDFGGPLGGGGGPASEGGVVGHLVFRQECAE